MNISKIRKRNRNVMLRRSKGFEICLRALIRKGRKILVCHRIGKNYYFLPGGHLEFGEKIKDGLSREIKEELHMKIKAAQLIGLIDNVFREEGRKHHEIDFIFEVKANRVSAKSQENHIDFVLFDKNRFAKEKVLPEALQKAILRWLKDRKFFWTSQFYNKSVLNKV